MDNKITTFEDLLVWKKSHELVLKIYKITEDYSKCEEFGLKQHTRKTAISIPSNIAEGFKRRSKADSIHFYNIAEGSLEELKYQLILARDLKYLSKKDYQNIRILSEEVGRLLRGWLKSQKQLSG